MIIPAIDILGNQVVRLFKGDYEQVRTYDIDPTQLLDSFFSDGAEWVHIVDLSGAENSENSNTSTIPKLIETASGKIQVGGGIRTMKRIESLLNSGVSRVIIGSLVIKNPDVVKEAFKKFGPEKICLALDVNIVNDVPQIAISGWKQNSGRDIYSVIHEFIPFGLMNVLCTDVSKDGTLSGSNTALYSELSNKYDSINFQASGGIGSLEDISEVSKSGVDSVICGRALLDKNFTYREAAQCWQKG